MCKCEEGWYDMPSLNYKCATQTVYSEREILDFKMIVETGYSLDYEYEDEEMYEVTIDDGGYFPDRPLFIIWTTNIVVLMSILGMFLMILATVGILLCSDIRSFCKMTCGVCGIYLSICKYTICLPCFCCFTRCCCRFKK